MIRFARRISIVLTGFAALGLLGSSGCGTTGKKPTPSSTPTASPSPTATPGGVISISSASITLSGAGIHSNGLVSITNSNGSVGGPVEYGSIAVIVGSAMATGGSVQAPPQAMPGYPLTAYQTGATLHPFAWAVTGTQTISGIHYVTGSVSIYGGALISGNATIVAEGDLSISGGSSVNLTHADAGNHVMLYAGGSLGIAITDSTLAGTGKVYAPNGAISFSNSSTAGGYTGAFLARTISVTSTVSPGLSMTAGYFPYALFAAN